MTALSSKDKLRLKVSKARVKAWNEYRRTDPHNPVDKNGERIQIRLRGLVMGEQDKPVESIGPDKMDVLYRNTDGGNYRSMSGKLGQHGNAIAARVHTITHTDLESGETVSQVVHCEPDGYDPIGNVIGQGKGDTTIYRPASEGPKHAKTRADSPFKKTGVRSLVIVRKG